MRETVPSGNGWRSAGGVYCVHEEQTRLMLYVVVYRLRESTTSKKNKSNRNLCTYRMLNRKMLMLATYCPEAVQSWIIHPKYY